MNKKAPALTKHIGFRVSPLVFNEIQLRADSEGKQFNDWCRDKAVEAAKQPTASQSERALLAEIKATQAITINLLFTLSANGKLTRDSVQQVIDAAHAAKHKEASELLKQASARSQPRRLEPPAAAASQTGGRR